MFKLCYGDLRTDAFSSALSKLENCDSFDDEKVSYNIMRMVKSLNKAFKDSQAEWAKLATEVFELDVAQIKTEDGKFVWKEGIDHEAGKAKFEAFNAKEVIIDRFKLKLEQLKPAKLSPAEMGALDALIQEPSQAS